MSTPEIAFQASIIDSNWFSCTLSRQSSADLSHGLLGDSAVQNCANKFGILNRFGTFNKLESFHAYIRSFAQDALTCTRHNGNDFTQIMLNSIYEPSKTFAHVQAHVSLTSTGLMMSSYCRKCRAVRIARSTFLLRSSSPVLAAYSWRWASSQKWYASAPRHGLSMPPPMALLEAASSVIKPDIKEEDKGLKMTAAFDVGTSIAFLKWKARNDD